MPEEGVENYDALKAEAEAANEAIKKKNETLVILKSKIGFEFVDKLPEPEVVLGEDGEPLDPQPEEELKRPRDPEDWQYWNEKCCIKI